MLNGILDKRIPRFGPKPMDMQGFFTIMMRHAVHNPEQERTFQDPCYAMVSDNYLNYTSRVGYHFGIVDTYCGQTVNKNYISFMFRGGAADMMRRNRRVRVIAGILQTYGFYVEINKDTLTARINKEPREKIMVSLEVIGRLLQFVRQMDVAMVSDESVEQVKNAFLTDNFTLK
jgi:pyruvate,water dikinase